MDKKAAQLAWLVMLLIGTASWMCYFWVLRPLLFPDRYDILNFLTLSHALIGLWTISLDGWSRRSWCLVALGFFVGQWWQIFWNVIVMLGWKINGFAP